MKIQLPIVMRVSLQENRFTTLGDWKETPQGFIITYTGMADWKYEFLVLIHEFTEWAICQRYRVPTYKCDAFDALWEAELKQGLHKLGDEAGFDRRCPYREGHVWGARMERLFAFLLGVRWKKYCEACDALMKEFNIV